MKTLLALRHAKSSWKDSSLSDHDRPLNKRGKNDAPRIGALLAREELIPDLIIASTAKRAANTAERVAESSGYLGEILYSRYLYGAGPEDMLEVLNELATDQNCVMIVGHNPGMEDLVEEFADNWERMPTSALAQIELAVGQWSNLKLETSGKLIRVWRPKEMI